MEKMYGNKQKGFEAELEALDILRRYRITAELGLGSYGQADIWATIDNTLTHIEVKRLKLCISAKHIGQIKLSRIQLEALKTSEEKGLYAFILIMIKTKGKTIPMCLLPSDIPQKPFYKYHGLISLNLTFYEVLDSLIPLKYILNFLPKLKRRQLSLMQQNGGNPK